MFDNIKINYGWDRKIGPNIVININEKKLGVCLCHRREDRSFKISGYFFPVCARCTGMFVGFIIVILLMHFGYNISLLYSFFLIIPLLIDGFTQNFGSRESTNLLRFATGIIFSIGLIYLGEYFI